MSHTPAMAPGYRSTIYVQRHMSHTPAMAPGYRSTVYAQRHMSHTPAMAAGYYTKLFLLLARNSDQSPWTSPFGKKLSALSQSFTYLDWVP